MYVKLCLKHSVSALHLSMKVVIKAPPIMFTESNELFMIVSSRIQKLRVSLVYFFVLHLLVSINPLSVQGISVIDD